MQYFTSFLNWIMTGCYDLCGNYGVAIILFTFISKIILLPVSVWTYMNGITMIKIQPDVNFLKVRYYGQKDQIAEQQAKLFKEKGYHPLLSTIPLIIQLVLLMGVVEVIKAGIANPAIDMNWGPVNLGYVPSEKGISLIWSPLVAGFAAWVLCIAQNASNVLQAEQSKMNKFSTTILSVGLSLYLGWFVSIGTALYWVASNLFAVLQLYICNWIIRPRRFIDYDRLEESRRQLAELEGVGKQKKDKEYYQNRKRERADYKRFFSVVNKHLVFYSESNGFYKYYKGYIEYILEHTNITIHYITSDPNDQIFRMEKENPRIRGYYIGENKLITLMMKMDADVVVMTMPDLENYHIKRSYVRDDVEYVYVSHGMGSNNLTLRKGSTDHYDTIFCAGPHQKEETEKTDAVYGLPSKRLLEIGYPMIDDLCEAYQKEEHKPNARKKILIAPSWQAENIVDSCLEQLLDKLRDSNYDIIVRPHPQEVRLKKEYMETLKKKFSAPNIEIQTDFTSNSPIMQADLLITDWSDISWEYAFTTLRPVMFIDTPMKVMNPEWQKIDTIPLNILLRDQVGMHLKLDELEHVKEAADQLLANTDAYRDRIEALGKQYIYNRGTSAQAGAEYLIDTITKKIQAKKAK